MFCQYLYTIEPYKIRILECFRSHLSIFLFPSGERGTPPPCPTRSVLRTSNNEDLFLQFCCYKCVLSIFIYNIALHNTDFGVLQKSSKHFLISIFFPFGEGDTSSLSHPPLLGTSGLEQWVHILYDAVVKNVSCWYLYTI